MVNDLKELMRENVDSPPADDLDVAALLDAGRRRVRRRRNALAGGVAVLAAGAVVGGSAIAGIGPAGGDRAETAGEPPAPNAPTLRLSDAAPAVEGEDYRVLTSYTNENLDQENGQYLDGVTDDGLVLFRDGPRMDQRYARMALMDPATGEREWLPELDVGQTQTWPVHLGSDRLVLVSTDHGAEGRLVAHVFDRRTQQWTTMQWPDLPAVDFPRGVVGPDDRLYVPTPATTGRPPEGGWPTGPDGEADDAGAEGDTYHLWSVSLTDSSDVRDEGLTVGGIAFTDTAMVWTDSDNGDPGMVHVRDLATGEETSFDPDTGEKCNLLGFGATGERIMMSQYCGTYAGGVRDDRVQILTTGGDQVVTLQDSGLEGWLPTGSDVVAVTVFDGHGDDRSGTYVYDLATDRFLRISDAISSYDLGGPTEVERHFLWHTPVNGGKGATQQIGVLLD